MEKDLQRQQSHLWEFYKTWVNNHAPLGDSKESEMHQLYEQLCLLLNTDSAPAIKQTKLKFEEKNFDATINFIVDVVGPEKIFCLNHQTEMDGTNYADLVLVIPEKCDKTFEEIEKAFEFVCLKHNHLSCTLFKSTFFHSMVADGHIYFSLACNPENQLYDDGSKTLPKLKLNKKPEKLEKPKKEFYSGMEKAKTFYTVAEGYRNTNPIMAAYMLHQAAELCLRALSRSLSNQEKTTHSLSALLKFSQRITPKLALVMDNGTAEDERLLILLEGAYLGYRYSEKYNIEESDLNLLFPKIKNLHTYTEESFLTWMNKYDLLINTAQNGQ